MIVAEGQLTLGYVFFLRTANIYEFLRIFAKYTLHPNIA